MQPSSASSSPPPSAASSFTVIDPSFNRRQLIRYGRPDTFVSASYGELPLLTKRELITPHVVHHTAHVPDVDSTITEMKGDIAATFKSAEYFCTLKLLFTLSIISQIDDTSVRRDKDVAMAAWVRDDLESPWKPSPRNKYMHKRRMLQSMRWAWLVCQKDDRENALLARRPFFTLTTLRDLPDAVLEMDDVPLARMWAFLVSGHHTGTVIVDRCRELAGLQPLDRGRTAEEGRVQHAIEVEWDAMRESAAQGSGAVDGDDDKEDDDFTPTTPPKRSSRFRRSRAMQEVETEQGQATAHVSTLSVETRRAKRARAAFEGSSSALSSPSHVSASASVTVEVDTAGQGETAVDESSRVVDDTAEDESVVDETAVDETAVDGDNSSSESHDGKWPCDRCSRLVEGSGVCCSAAACDVWQHNECAGVANFTAEQLDNDDIIICCRKHMRRRCSMGVSCTHPQDPCLITCVRCEKEQHFRCVAFDESQPTPWYCNCCIRLCTVGHCCGVGVVEKRVCEQCSDERLGGALQFRASNHLRGRCDLCCIERDTDGIELSLMAVQVCARHSGFTWAEQVLQDADYSGDDSSACDDDDNSEDDSSSGEELESEVSLSAEIEGEKAERKQEEAGVYDEPHAANVVSSDNGESGTDSDDEPAWVYAEEEDVEVVSATTWCATDATQYTLTELWARELVKREVVSEQSEQRTE